MRGACRNDESGDQGRDAKYGDGRATAGVGKLPWNPAQNAQTLVGVRTRKDQQDHADPSSYTAGVKGIEKLEHMRQKFRVGPEENVRHMMEKVYGTAPDLAMYLDKCRDLPQCRLSTYLGVLLVEIMSAAEQEHLGRLRGLTAGGVQLLEQWIINGALELG